ncbi:MAG: hypothetical protein R3F61_17550 [Myxococcota bacterium]
MRTLMVSLAALALGAPAMAAPPIRNGGNLGLGLGATTSIVGLDTKYWMNPNLSFQALLGVYDIGRGFDDLALGVDADVLVEVPLVDADDAFDLGLALGAGGVFASGANADLDLVAGANLVVGIEGNIDAVPLDVVIDYRPTIWLLDDLDGLDDDFRLDFVELGVHVRYWF